MPSSSSPGLAGDRARQDSSWRPASSTTWGRCVAPGCPVRGLQPRLLVAMIIGVTAVGARSSDAPGDPALVRAGHVPGRVSASPRSSSYSWCLLFTGRSRRRPRRQARPCCRPTFVGLAVAGRLPPTIGVLVHADASHRVLHPDAVLLHQGRPATSPLPAVAAGAGLILVFTARSQARQRRRSGSGRPTRAVPDAGRRDSERTPRC